ncbi:MAG: hypothetical protein AAF399_04095 [Bacteroidota bacterium]
MRLFICTLCLLLFDSLLAQSIWEVSTYPDEIGFTQRTTPMLSRIAETGFGTRSLATSRCPDTGLPVKTWAVAGDTIISPYTGRDYVQGPTGYFGPKARTATGEILAFGGDPLKYDLPPATAQLLLQPDDRQARAFLSIPGNLRQQYHFACKNWARFYPLLSKQMGADWQKEFQHWVGEYAEARRPSDGNREMLPLSKAHNLVGEVGMLLGGNPKDGGTENHKTMWRTSALVYSQWFPDTATISGFSAAETERLTKFMLREYLQRILETGNGEYDSQVYYPHSIEGFLNVYDFGKDEESRQLAKFALDYYFATFGLKVVDGAIAGAQKRGYLPGKNASEMEIMQWAFFDQTSRNMEEVTATIQQSTTTYRPNELIWKLARKEISLPFEAKMSRPFYHMDRPHAFAEYFYASESFGMGNVQMTIVDNPNQQMVWSLIAEGERGPLAFSGGHPMRGSTSGHSPYTQTFQSKGSLLVLTAPTRSQVEVDTLLAPHFVNSARPNLWHLPKGEQGEDFERRNRQKYAANPLHTVPAPDPMSVASLNEFWRKSKGSASTWLFFSKELRPIQQEDLILWQANQTLVAARPFGKETGYLVAPPESVVAQLDRSAKKFFESYSIWVFPGEVSGYVLEVAEASEYASLDAFSAALRSQTKLNIEVGPVPEIAYTSLSGEQMSMRYQPTGLRCMAALNGTLIDWDAYTDGAVYDSPYLKVKNGRMWVSDGAESYEVDFRQSQPSWK